MWQYDRPSTPLSLLVLHYLVKSNASQAIGQLKICVKVKLLIVYRHMKIHQSLIVNLRKMLSFIHIVKSNAIQAFGQLKVCVQ